MNEINKLLVERDTLCATADAAGDAIDTCTSRIKSLLFPSEILDDPVEIETDDGTYQAVINSRLEWNQDELAKLVADPDCGPFIKERLSVTRKDYDRMPPHVKEKFNDAVTRKTGTVKIKRV